MIQNINWYPGHMKKTRELIQENLKAVDLVIELLDSRIPISSRNPIIDELVGDKRRIVLLGKSDPIRKRPRSGSVILAGRGIKPWPSMPAPERISIACSASWTTCSENRISCGR